ncbi:hypothetical protein QBC35DRAFT_502296 [Podospora australis]|uniref:Mitochondrial carrier protein pet8 n=1 Tax=Podospora australis TaxID=1536484 RepID=A0AAN6WQC5_9PEZI|nr:hypothetical protein QBC35DRAFT_502296 [Podospora australis]
MFSRALIRTPARAAAAAAAPSISLTSRRAFTQTSFRSLKESASSDPNPDDFEHHKQDSLKKQKEGNGHWKPELASVSEETIKADRMGPKETNEAALKRLQDQTKGHAENSSKNTPPQ